MIDYQEKERIETLCRCQNQSKKGSDLYHYPTICNGVILIQLLLTYWLANIDFHRIY
jgi:hypothetical protein